MKSACLLLVVLLFLVVTPDVAFGPDKVGGDPGPQGGICVDPNGRPMPCPPA